MGINHPTCLYLAWIDDPESQFIQTLNHRLVPSDGASVSHTSMSGHGSPEGLVFGSAVWATQALRPPQETMLHFLKMVNQEALESGTLKNWGRICSPTH